MYRLATDFDLDQFVGISLEAIVFATYKVDLLFSGDYRLGIESDVSIDFDQPVGLPALLSLLYPLINQEVIAVGRSTTGRLDFTFDQGKVLHVHDSSTQYECYSIEHKGKLLARV